MRLTHLPAVVAPWLPVRSACDRWLSAELDETVDECVDDTAELLDAIAGLHDQLDDGGHGEAVTASARRAAAAFAVCEAVGRRCGAELAKCGSNLRKLGEQALLHARHHQPDDEALADARGVALLAAGALDTVLAFRPRCMVPGVSVSGVPCMAELDAAATAVKAVKSVVAGAAWRAGSAQRAAAALWYASVGADEVAEESAGEARG